MKDQYAAIVAGCLAAFDSLKRGESHERANQMMNRTAAKNAAFLLPEINQRRETRMNTQPSEWCLNVTRNGALAKQNKDYL